MTYQGLKSLLYAQVGRDDERVVKAFEWISKNFTVRENPGMASRSDPDAGQQGLFYYYHTFAKALACPPIGVPDLSRKLPATRRRHLHQGRTAP